MDTTIEHNQALQERGFFSVADLEANRQRRFSSAQLKRFKDEQIFTQRSARKYEERASPLGSILTVGLLLVAVALDFNGNLKVLEDILGNFFMPIMLGTLVLVILFIVVIIPLQYRDWVDAYNAKRKLLAMSPLRTIHVIEGQAEVYQFEGVGDRQGRHFHPGSHVLQMDTIKLLIPKSLSQVIDPRRSYRVYAILDHGTWVLLSMETNEGPQADEVRIETPYSTSIPVTGNHTGS